MRIVTLIYWVFTFFSAQGDNTIDSLLYQLTVSNDTSRYSLLTQLADAYYYNSQFELSASFYKKAAELAERDKYPNLRHISESYGNYGYCLFELGQYTEAIKLYEKALVAAGNNYDSTEMAAHHSNIGISYFQLGNYEKSINHYQNALNIDKALNNIENIGIDYSVLGNVLATWDKQAEAKQFFKNALEIARKISNPEQVSIRLNKLGSTYMALEQYDTALICLQESLSIAYTLANDSRIAGILNQIGFTYQNTKSTDLAMHYYQNALEKTHETNDVELIASIYANMCENCIGMHDYKNAEIYCLKSLENAQNIGLANVTVKNYESLAKIHYAKGDFKKAFEYQELFSSLKDSIFTRESQSKLAEFQAIHETEEKENEIKLLNSANLIQEIYIRKAEQRFYFLIAITVLLMVVIGLVYYQYNNRKKINTLLAEKNLQLQQLNSTKDRFISIIAHDLKNPFSAFYNIASSLFKKKSVLSSSEKDRLIESIYHSSEKLKEMLNSLLQWARLQKDQVTVEIEQLNLREIVNSSIELNTGISQARNISVENKVDKDQTVTTDKNTLLTVINNLLTNAIKFSTNGQKVILSSISENNHIDLIVEDRGIGISQSEINKLFRIDVDTRKIGKSPEKGTGMGLILCKELLDKIRGTIKVESEPGKGSKFIVSIPYIIKN